jgi:L-alanine-DL-glutamate epimerase-like enolase superfamily enzyme
MRITGIEVIELRVPGWTAHTFDGSYDNCVIRISTDAGIEGIAEVDSVPSVIRAIIEAPSSHTHARGLQEVVVGQDPLEIEAVWERMYDATSYYGRRGVVIHALSAIDIALWDIKGKALDKPVSELLGTRRRDRLKAYGTVYPTGRNGWRGTQQYRPRAETGFARHQDRRRPVLARRPRTYSPADPHRARACGPGRPAYGRCGNGLVHGR